MAISRETLCGLLAMLMSEISENCMASGWEGNLEYTLWDALLSKPLWSRWQDSITQTDLRMLKELSAEIDGWITWDDQANGNDDTDPMWNRRFVPLDEWQQMYAQHVAREKA